MAGCRGGAAPPNVNRGAGIPFTGSRPDLG
jgi:hypothetical protein